MEEQYLIFVEDGGGGGSQVHRLFDADEGSGLKEKICQNLEIPAYKKVFL